MMSKLLLSLGFQLGYSATGALSPTDRELTAYLMKLIHAVQPQSRQAVPSKCLLFPQRKYTSPQSITSSTTKLPWLLQTSSRCLNDLSRPSHQCHRDCNDRRHRARYGIEISAGSFAVLLSLIAFEARQIFSCLNG